MRYDEVFLHVNFGIERLLTASDIGGEVDSQAQN
jgi:hypothetical protein